MEREQHRTQDSDEVAALLRGLRLGFIAVISAALTAAVVIGVGNRETNDANPYYGELTRISDS